MIMLRMILKVLLFPVLILLTLIECICSAAVNLSGVFFRLIAGVFILTGILSAGFGLEPWSEAVRIIMGGIVFLLLPVIAEIITAGISLLKVVVRTI